MPIRPSQRKLYPPRKEWLAIRAAIMQRAGNECECIGECGDKHEMAGRCLAPHDRMISRAYDDPAMWVALVEESPLCTAVRCILTIAHLDHDPTNNDHGNLRALCQRCHLRYDHAEHMRNARETRRSRKACGELFE